MKRRPPCPLLLVALTFVALLLNAKEQRHKPASSSDAAAASTTWPVYTLRAEANWQLDLPEGERFDASGLCLRQNGELLTVNDQREGIYRIDFLQGTNAAALTRVSDCFTPKQLERFAGEKMGPYDCEGVCEDALGRLYVCEEANRWILRFDPATKKLERLDIDWAPVEKYFHPTDRNASFEGITIHGNTLYVANERQDGRIIVVDLNTLRVVDDFAVRPSRSRAKDIHYTDLCWYEGALFVLLRDSHVILRVDPDTKSSIAEYDFFNIEHDPEFDYEKKFTSANLMEGLAVDDKYFWICTDNGGYGRRKYPNDKRPTLFKCPRPDVNP